MTRDRRANFMKVKRGLDIPIAGAPAQAVTDAAPVASVGLLGDDYPGLKPELLVREGDRVVLGQAVLADRSNPGALFTAPGCGTVSAVNRAARRSLQSLVIELDGDGHEAFASWPASRIASLSGATVRENLVASGLWTALRTRPYGRVPPIAATPAALFINAMDTNPLAAAPETIIARSADDFADGILLLSKLCEGPVYVCTAPGSRMVVPQDPRIREICFAGPHPAGLVGTHIHFLEPVGPRRTVWHINYQDAIATAQLFKTGRLSVERIVSLAGGGVQRPRLIRTRVGANTDELLLGELARPPGRVISGSVLAGRSATAGAAFLGRYHLQISVIPEALERHFLGWLAPGFDKFSASRIFAASLFAGKSFDLTTSQHGSPRAMVPIGTFEKVMPLDLLITPLLKALMVRDTETAKLLGCLELEEEDLALCSFVCNGKSDYGAVLRDCLDVLEKTG